MFKTDPKDLKKQTKVFEFGASTPGGQRANKKATGIRLLHLPSGVKVPARGRSRARNLKTAFANLQERLEKLNQPETPRVATRPSAGSEARRLESKKERKEKKTLRKTPEVSQ